MGCETSRLQEPEPSKNNKALRRNNKKVEKIIGGLSDNVNITENVLLSEENITSKDQLKIAHIISPHFFFSNISKNERIGLIEQMLTYKCSQNQYVFQQNSPGTLFFIIKSGKVGIEINGKQVKTMEKGQSFGELSLLYTAPRSASVKAITDCVFWGLHQSIFRKYTEQLVKKNYKIAKPFLQKIPLFQFLSPNQMNSIAYSMNNLKYNPNENIFKQGDDANSFYIVTEGQVKIYIKEKEPITLQKGDSFGQNSFKKNQVRSGTAAAGSSGANLLSIGRQGLLKCLGNNIQQLIQFNILKWALKRSKIFSNIPNELIRKFIRISQVRECSDNQIIIKEKEHLNYFIVPIQGRVNNYDVGTLINEDYLIESASTQKDIQIRTTLKKQGRGNVYMIPIKKIESLLGLNLFEATRRNQDIFKNTITTEVNISNFNAVEKNNLNLMFKDLIYVKQLGEGQFGKVYLVKAKGSVDQYALKIIKKKAVINMNLHKFIKNEKQILLKLNHPFIVKLEQTFKDQAFLYLLMQYIDGVDFFDMLRQIGLCNLEISRFYLATLILCIQQLHSQNIVYRDLKPENAVVDSKGFLHMIDLGTAKKLSEQKGNRTFTIIGTPHYMAPQIIQGKGYGLQVDIWSLGVMLYEMVCGKLPYGEQLDDPYQIYQQVTKEKLMYPSYYHCKKGKQLIQKLMQRNSIKREIEDFSSLKRESFFEGFKWQDLVNKKIKPPVVPKKKKNSNNSQGQQLMIKYLAKDIIAEAVKQPIQWDQDF